jgi:hypothetical protein
MTVFTKLPINSGQALTTLLIIMFFGITITAVTAALVSLNSLSTSSLEESNQSLMAAESGIENSLLRELRDPSYVGETLPVGTGNAVVTITPGNPVIINSQGNVGNHRRTLQVTITYTSGVLVVDSWKEI